MGKKKKSQWPAGLMKRLLREDPERSKKAERDRGFTPPMPFCECDSKPYAPGVTWHQLWCPVVGGGGKATKPADTPPSWHLGTGWVGCDCGLQLKMQRGNHAFTCPVRTCPVLSANLPDSNYPGKLSEPTPKPAYPEFPKNVVKTNEWLTKSYQK